MASPPVRRKSLPLGGKAWWRAARRCRQPKPSTERPASVLGLLDEIGADAFVIQDLGDAVAAFELLVQMEMQIGGEFQVDTLRHLAAPEGGAARSEERRVG